MTLGLASFAADIPVDVGLLVCRSFSFVSRKMFCRSFSFVSMKMFCRSFSFVSRKMSSKSFSCVSSFGFSTDFFTRCLYYYTYALEKIYIFAALVY